MLGHKIRSHLGGKVFDRGSAFGCNLTNIGRSVKENQLVTFEVYSSFGFPLKNFSPKSFNMVGWGELEGGNPKTNCLI